MSVEPVPAPSGEVLHADVAEKATTERLIWTHRWAPHLFSFRVTRSPDFQFVTGQFARLGLMPDQPPGSETVWRPYSIASAPMAEHLEFCSVVVPGGQFTERLFASPLGTPMLVERSPYGFLTTERFSEGTDLWMIATGTGLAPFVSMLYDKQHWRDYQHLIVVHSVRRADELAYRDAIEAFNRNADFRSLGARLIYVPIVTRERVPGALETRIPDLIENGLLEQTVGRSLEPVCGRALLCGNPQMVKAVRAQLSARGFAPPRRGQAGSLAVENYW